MNKRCKLTEKQLDVFYKKVIEIENPIGFIGKIPVMANKKVPKGELWILSLKELRKL